MLPDGQPSRWLIAGAFVLVAILLLACTLFGGHLLSGSNSDSDESAYLYLAHNLIHGKYAVATQQNDGLYLWHGPGLALILAPMAALHLSVRVMRLVGPASLLIAGILFMLLLRRWVSPWVALAGGIALAVFPPFLRLLPNLYSEPLALMLFVAGMLVLAKAHESARLRWCVSSGVLVGFSVLTRVDEGWLLLAALALAALAAVWRRRRSHTVNLLAAVAAVIVCLPWLIYTDSLAHKFPYWAASGGESLYWMAVPVGTGSWVNYHQVLDDPRWRSQRPLFERLLPQPQVHRDAQLQHIALKLIRADPGNYAKHVAENLARIVIGGPYTFQGTGAGRYLLYGASDLALLLALLLAGVWIIRRRPLPMPAFVVVLGAFSLINVVYHVPVAAYPRMTTLSIPAALAVIAIGLQARLRPRKQSGGGTGKQSGGETGKQSGGGSEAAPHPRVSAA